MASARETVIELIGSLAELDEDGCSHVEEYAKGLIEKIDEWGRCMKQIGCAHSFQTHYLTTSSSRRREYRRECRLCGFEVYATPDAWTWPDGSRVEWEPTP